MLPQARTRCESGGADELMRTIAIAGGTGAEGRGLALRFALAGERVIVGSRSPERARNAAVAATERLLAFGAAGSIDGAANAEGLDRADVVVLAVPWECAGPFVTENAARLGRKIVLDVVNPLQLRGGSFRLVPVEAGSAGETLQALIPEARLVSAFKNESAELLNRIEQPIEGDVVVCSDHDDARRQVIELVGKVPNLRGVDAGPLRNVRSVEAMTPLLLNLNLRHCALTSIRVLGLPGA